MSDRRCCPQGLVHAWRCMFFCFLPTNLQTSSGSTRSVRMIAGGEVDETMLEALEDYVKR